MIQVPMNVTQGMIQPQPDYAANQYVTAPLPAPINSEPAQAQYNAVSITVHKPAVEAGSTDCCSPYNYNYTPAPLYTVPQGSIYEPGSIPAQTLPAAAPVSLPSGSEPAEQVPAAPVAVEQIGQPAQYQVPESVIPPAEAESQPAVPIDPAAAVQTSEESQLPAQEEPKA